MSVDLLVGAPWAGEHALEIFGGLLATLLLATVALWWGERRIDVARHPSPRLSGLYLGLWLAAGFAVIMTSAWLFAEIAEKLGTTGRMGLADQALADSLKVHLPLAALQVFAWLTHLADTVTVVGVCALVAAVLLLRGRRGLALGWVLTIAGNGLLNVTLKQIFARVRPVHDGGLVAAQGFGFPSGHSSGSVVMYGMLAYVLCRFVSLRWQLPVVLAAVTLAFSVGVSRVFLRVHFASDVLAGFISGTAWLVVCIAGMALTRWMQLPSKN